jgi:sarcosine oxidase
VGIERFAPPHDRGSSHGQTRIIRQAYFEHPDYVPLLKRSYELWREVEAETGRKLYHPTGLLEVGPPDGVVLPGVLESARLHNLDVEKLTADEARRRFPGFVIPDGCEAVFERDAGYLRVEDCVRTHVDEALRLGAELRTGEAVQAWRFDGGQFVVETDRDRYTAPRLVLAPGSWAGQLLAELQAPGCGSCGSTCTGCGTTIRAFARRTAARRSSMRRPPATTMAFRRSTSAA